jgi:exodeoxyribonuclease-3
LESPAEPGTLLQMLLATYNVNGIKTRLPRLLDWLAEARPDVACLQETKSADARFPHAAIEAAGYGVVWHGMPSHHGVAVLARRGLALREVRRGLPGDDADGEARYLEVDVAPAGAATPLRIASVYLPNGNPQPGPRFDYKLAWFRRLIAHASTLVARPQPVVLAGDFNVVPTDADIYNAWWWREDAVMQPESRACWQQLLAQGWVDATRALHPGERIYTFWTTATAFARNAGFRMDMLLLNPAAARALRATGVHADQRGRDKPSDHAPVWVELG